MLQVLTVPQCLSPTPSSCICVDRCTSLWFPERPLGSQSPVALLNAADPHMCGQRSFWRRCSEYVDMSLQALSQCASAGWGNGAVWVEGDSEADASAGVLKGKEQQ